MLKPKTFCFGLVGVGIEKPSEIKTEGDRKTHAPPPYTPTPTHTYTHTHTHTNTETKRKNRLTSKIKNRVRKVSLKRKLKVSLTFGRCKRVGVRVPN